MAACCDQESREPTEPETQAAEPAHPAAEEGRPAALEVHELTNEDGNRRLDQFLSEKLSGHSRSFLQKLISSGCVELDPPPGKPVKASLKIAPGTRVKIEIPPPRKMSLEPVAIPLNFLHEDEHLAVIDKPAGITVHIAFQQ